MPEPTVTKIDESLQRAAIKGAGGEGPFTKEAGKVNSLTAEYVELQADRDVCERVWGGSKTMHAAGEKALRKWDGETTKEYNARLKAATLTNYFRTAVETMIDDAYQEPLIMDPDEVLDSEQAALLERWWKNVDRRGSSGSQCARDTSESSLAFGRPAILIDFPRLDQPAESQADEQQRFPRLKEIRASNIVEAVWGEVDGDFRLLSVRYYDPTEERLPFGSKRVERFTVLRRGGLMVNEDGQQVDAPSRMEIYVADEKSGEYPDAPTEVRFFEPPATLSPERRAMFREIPIVFKQTGREPTPKLLGLAELNGKHFAKESNFDTAEEVSGVPFDIFLGFTEEDMESYQRGPYRYLRTPKGPNEAARVDGSFKFDSAKVMLESLKRLEDAMSMMAKMPKMTRATGSERATIRLRDDKAKLSRLQAWFLQWLGADQRVLNWASLWLGLPASGRLGYVKEVFESLVIDPNLGELLDTFDRVVEYPEPLRRVALKEAQRYGTLDRDIELDDTEDETGRVVPGLLSELAQAGPVLE